MESFVAEALFEESLKQIVQQFEQDLVYGTTFRMFDRRMAETRLVTVYLHETYINQLVVLDLPRFKVIDLQRCRVEKLQPRLEVEHDIKNYIVLRDAIDSIILLFNDTSERNNHYNNFSRLVQRFRHYYFQIDSNNMKLFLETDNSHNGFLSLDQVSQLMKRLKMTPDERIFKMLAHIQKDIQHKGQLTMVQFEMFSRLLSCKLEVLGIFQKYCRCKLMTYENMIEGIMTKEQFEHFLKKQQFMLEECQIQKTIDIVYMDQGEKLSFYHFSAYIFSKENSVLDSQKIAPFSQDHPLHHYFCLSSHNTYLSGNQLTSNSKIERYLEDLEDGIRCVELDIHDDGKVPIIKHGYTATSPILFEDVIRMIQEFCVANPKHTPIILSLENHCSESNQQKVAEILLRHFCSDLKEGRILTVEPGAEYPTLKAMRGKIIIKGKGTYNDVESVKKGTLETEESIDEGPPSPEIKRRLPVTFARKKGNFFQLTLKLQEKKKLCQKNLKKAWAYVGTNLSLRKATSVQLQNITGMLSNGKLGKANCWQSVSLSENAMRNYMMKKQLVRSHSRDSWIRVYPSGSRFDSSNYNPLPMLEMGAQIVALNTQSKSIQTCILYSFFSGSKNQQGYLLKPEYLRLHKSKFSENKPKLYTFEVISCHGLINQEQVEDIPPVQVLMGLFCPEDEAKGNLGCGSMSPYTEVVLGNNYNPQFKKSIQFKCTIRQPFFAVVCLEVPKCGQAAIPLRLVRQGYRCVPLLDSSGKGYGSYILVHITVS